MKATPKSAIEIIRYTDAYIENVRQFNRRMELGGEGEYQLPNDLRQFEASAGGPLPWEGWLAVDDGVVRGGYLLRWQEFSFHGEIRKLAFYNLSVSEGAIDRMYAPVSMRMISSAVVRAPLTFALGMGGVHKRLPRFLHAFGWKLYEIPFLFRAVHANRVVRNIRTIRTTALRRAALDIAAFTGVAWAAITALQAFRRKAPKRSGIRFEVVRNFDAWADSVWTECASSFAMIGVRDSQALNELYSEAMPRISRLRVYSDTSVVGWAVVLNTQMKGHKQFGNLHVGTVVDLLSLPANAAMVAEAADRFLESAGVDIIVTNQSHEAFRTALRNRGYFEGPSNYALATSKELTRFINDPSRIHLTRGDGDGPIHL